MSFRRVAGSHQRLGANERPWPGEEAVPSTEPPPRRSSSPAAGGGTYFRRVHPLWMALVAAGMVYYSWVVFSPATIPYDSLGPLGTFTRYLVENHKASLNVGYGIAWLIHIVETIFALRLFREKGITDKATQLRWTIQTFLFGIFSLSLLKNYDPLKERKHQ